MHQSHLLFIPVESRIATISRTSTYSLLLELNYVQFGSKSADYLHMSMVVAEWLIDVINLSRVLSDMLSFYELVQIIMF